MTKADLVRRMAGRTGFTQADARDFLEELRDLAIEELQRGNTFALPAWARFRIVEVGARTFRNPRTGERVDKNAYRKIKCTVTPAFGRATLSESGGG